MNNVYIFGSMNTDLVINCPREIASGETIRGSGFLINRGGKGANQAVACGRLGGRIGNVYMGGCVGDDDFGKSQIAGLAENGVRTDFIRVAEATPSGVAVIVVIDGDNRIIIDGGANDKAGFSDADALLSGAKAGDIFLTQLENRVEVVGYALKKAKEKGLTVMLNPAPMNPEIIPYLGYVDIILPNEHEFRDLTSTDDYKAGSEKLHALGIRTVIVTLGDKGYCVARDGNVNYYDGIKAVAVDTTAAGDTFCGAFAARLARGERTEDALAFANKAASISVTRKGAQQSVPEVNEVLG